MKYLFHVILGLMCVSSITANAANLKDDIAAPKTKLEEFTAKTGVVIIRGFEEIGTINGLYGTSAKVEVKEFLNAASGKKEYGITIEVKKEDGRISRENTSYIDYDEISSLISGIDYIAKVKPSATSFSNYQADYNTKGDFNISTFNSGHEDMCAIKSGHIGSVSAYFNIRSLQEIRSVIENAKNKLDAVKK
jgi:hypothetical protein